MSRSDHSRMLSVQVFLCIPLRLLPSSVDRSSSSSQQSMFNCRSRRARWKQERLCTASSSMKADVETFPCLYEFGHCCCYKGSSGVGIFIQLYVVSVESRHLNASTSTDHLFNSDVLMLLTNSLLFPIGYYHAVSASSVH